MLCETAASMSPELPGICQGTQVLAPDLQEGGTPYIFFRGLRLQRPMQQQRRLCPQNFEDAVTRLPDFEDVVAPLPGFEEFIAPPPSFEDVLSMPPSFKELVPLPPSFKDVIATPSAFSMNKFFTLPPDFEDVVAAPPGFEVVVACHLVSRSMVCCAAVRL